MKYRSSRSMMMCMCSVLWHSVLVSPCASEA